MSHATRKSRQVERQRESGRFPWSNETWGDFIARRADEDARARRSAARVFWFLIGMIGVAWLAEQIYMGGLS